METRHLIAYLLIAALAAFVVGVWRYLTRERRAYQRAYRRSRKRRLEALADLHQ
jgi:hypothetical protein